MAQSGEVCSLLIEDNYIYDSNYYRAFPYQSFWSLLYGGSLLLYSFIWTILILHLLIIWATTWVLGPLDTPSSLLWVGIAKATLFRGPLHINAASVLVVEHLMGRQKLFLELFYRHALVCLRAVLVFSFGKL